jgi:hypothetical protein
MDSRAGTGRGNSLRRNHEKAVKSFEAPDQLEAQGNGENAATDLDELPEELE